MSGKRHTSADEPYFLIRSLRQTLPEGFEIHPHAHDWHQLIHASAGIMTVSADKGRWVVPPQWAIWAPAGVRHAVQFTGASEFATVYLRPGDWDVLPVTSTVVAVSPLLRALILRACETGMLDRRDPVHAAAALLLVDCLRAQPARALGLPMPSSADLKRVADACSKAKGDRGLQFVAARAGLSLRTLERRFSAETGMTLGQWRRHAR